MWKLGLVLARSSVVAGAAGWCRAPGPRQRQLLLLPAQPAWSLGRPWLGGIKRGCFALGVSDDAVGRDGKVEGDEGGEGHGQVLWPITPPSSAAARPLFSLGLLEDGTIPTRAGRHPACLARNGENALGPAVGCPSRQRSWKTGASRHDRRSSPRARLMHPLKSSGLYWTTAVDCGPGGGAAADWPRGPLNDWNGTGRAGQIRSERLRVR